FKRDLKLAGIDDSITIPIPSNDKVIVSERSNNLLKDKKIVLEEFTFNADESDLSELIGFLKRSFPGADAYNYWRQKLETNLIVMNDDDFRNFAKSST